MRSNKPNVLGAKSEGIETETFVDLVTLDDSQQLSPIEELLAENEPVSKEGAADVNMAGNTF